MWIIALTAFADFQAAARRELHPLANVLGLMSYSDGSQAQIQKHHYHFIIMYRANFTLDAMRSQRGYVRLAHMSVLDF